VIILDDKVEKTQNKFLYQLTHITRTKGALRHDDRIDVFAMGVKFISDSLKLDTTQTEERIKEERRDIYFKRLMAAASVNTKDNTKDNLGDWFDNNGDNIGDNARDNISIQDELMSETPWWLS
jgi:hypothetical protein